MFAYQVGKRESIVPLASIYKHAPCGAEMRVARDRLPFLVAPSPAASARFQVFMPLTPTGLRFLLRLLCRLKSANFNPREVDRRRVNPFILKA